MHRVAALVHAPQSTFELACAAEVFGIERRELPTRYSFGVCTENPGPVATRAGYDMLVTEGLDALDRADTVIVPGWLPTDEPPSPAVVRARGAGGALGGRAGGAR
ncbi:AraC family transcriptional regulator, partial [Streptomyces anulatus]